MKKIILLFIASSCLQITAQQHVVLASMECIYKPLRIAWHCTKIGIAFPQFDCFRRCARNYSAIMNGYVESITPQMAHTYMAVTGIGGVSSLYGGLVGLKRELWNEKQS